MQKRGEITLCPIYSPRTPTLGMYAHQPFFAQHSSLPPCTAYRHRHQTSMAKRHAC